MRTIKSNDMIASKQYARAAVAAARGDEIEDSHIREGRVAPTDSHMRGMAAEQFHAPHSIWRRGSRHVVWWAKNPDYEPIVAVLKM